MPRAKRAAPLYQRGAYTLDWDASATGARRPFLTVFWYDPERRKVRRASTGTSDVEEAKQWLDSFYLERTTGQATCRTCGQPIRQSQGHTVIAAIDTYQELHASKLASADAISARLCHVVDYLEAKDQTGLTCDQVDENWIARFRTWTEQQPIVSPTGIKRERSLSTVEASVAQLSAAINHAYRRGDTRGPARFKVIPIRGLNRTPEHRSDVAELASMFRYCVSPKAKDEEERSRRIRERASLHRFLMLSVATLARPDAVIDVNTDPERRQWNSKKRLLNLNPAKRRQTQKHRAAVPIAAPVAEWLDATHADWLRRKAEAEAAGEHLPLSPFFVGPKSVRKAWEGMVDDLGLPSSGEAGMKLIRRSVADLLRERLPAEAWIELEIFLGHQRFNAVSDLYAPFRPDYLRRTLAEIERLVAEIETIAPGAFHPTCTPQATNVVPIGRPRNA